MSSQSKLAVVIMAAGKGTRLKSARPKVLHTVGGKPLVGHVIRAAETLVTPADIYTVIGHQAERVEAELAATGVQFVLQAEQKGTGHAVQCAADQIRGYESVLILSGDVPLIRPETLERLLSFHNGEQAAMTILTARPADPFGYGRIVRRMAGTAEVEAIVEQKQLSPAQQSIGEINSGIYVFRTAALLEKLGQITDNNAAGELYLTDVAHLLCAAGERVVAVEAAEANEVLGANTIAELVALDSTLRMRTAHRLMAQGVTIFRPETSVIDSEVEVGADTVIEPFVQLLGQTRIGGNCLIRSYSVVENCTVGSDVLLRQNTIATDSTIGDGAKIGPFAHLRPQSEIGPDAHVGNFVETKKARLGRGAKANHLSYIGDAVVGEKTNIGAGVITCNYDGVNKFQTTIGAGSFIGSDSTLVAPVTVGDGAYIGAGSCITHDVPSDALSVGRARQITKEGWAAGKRARQKK